MTWGKEYYLLALMDNIKTLSVSLANSVDVPQP